MSRFVEGQARYQVTLLPGCLDDYIAEDNAVRVVDAFLAELDMVALGFEGATPSLTGRPSYHLAVMLKIYLYGRRPPVSWDLTPKSAATQFRGDVAHRTACHRHRTTQRGVFPSPH